VHPRRDKCAWASLARMSLECWREGGIHIAPEEEVRLVLPRGKGSKVKIDPRWLKRLILEKSVSEQNEQVIRAWARQRAPDLAVVKARYDSVEQTIKLGL
jgi:hypothetical protein